MGIYIKGMKPPKDCYECPCKQWVDDGCAGCWADDKIHNASRPDDCQLIEVSEPHGDLIDRDALEKAGRYEIYFFKGKTAKVCFVTDKYLYEFNAVIEAEGSDDT